MGPTSAGRRPNGTQGECVGECIGECVGECLGDPNPNRARPDRHHPRTPGPKAGTSGGTPKTDHDLSGYGFPQVIGH